VRTQRYSLLTWAPLSLLLQFKRVSNIYFLIISILTFMSFSPKNPLSMISTFVLVLVFTMIKEGYEDY
jgi:phospholipid-transporting ATPase